MNVKVLKLDMWMTKPVWRDECVASDNYAEIEPIFNRDGYYRRGDLVWFEVEGKAWQQKDIRDHEFDLQLFNAMELRPEAITALQAIAKSKIATVKQRQMYHAWRHAMDARDAYREQRLFMMKYRKELEQE